MRGTSGSGRNGIRLTQDGDGDRKEGSGGGLYEDRAFNSLEERVSCTHRGEKMSIYDELSRLGYEFDHEYDDSEERAEVWVNRTAGTGVLIEWFNLPEVAQ